jgi:hypothetical protein
MSNFSRFLAVCAALSALSLARAGTIDLGNLASDGSGGRQMVMRPMTPDDNADWPWQFFVSPIPGVSSTPTPATPSQESYYLLENEPLILAIPLLQHFPIGADVAAHYSVSGHEMIVDATMHYLGYFTHTIYGPHEYLLPVSGLSSGQYNLTFNLTYSGEGAGVDDRTTGYMDFMVHAVPEPTIAAFTTCVALLIGIGCRMRRA